MQGMFWQELPRALALPGGPCPIQTDFRAYVRLTETLLKEQATREERLLACFSLFKEEPADGEAALTALLDFYRQGPEGAEGTTRRAAEEGGRPRGSGRPVLSYTVDGWYIVGAFWEHYGIDLLRIPYLHWWEFCGLLAALPGDCPLKQRMYYRSLRPGDIADKAERRRIRRIQRALALPGQPVTDGEIGAALWKEGETDGGR